MLDPKAQLVLLPQDREIMELTGLDEKQYRKFQLYVLTQKPKPGDPVALGFLATAAINLAIGLLLTAASALLAPKEQEQKENDYEESKVDGQDVIRKDRFTAKSGFDSVQNVVELGSVVPIIYAKRETLDGNQYGGLRVNTNLLWSQLLSVGGGQFFRGQFMVGESGPEIDVKQTALGNNTLAAYDLQENQEAGRATIYYSADGGRINANDDYQLGVMPGADIGCESFDDVYGVKGLGNLPGPNFCMAVNPTNQTIFGLYNFCGSRFFYRIGEKFEPLSQWQARGDADYEFQYSNSKRADNSKNGEKFSLFSGFLGTANGDVPKSKGDLLTYVIYPKSDKDEVFTETGSGNSEPDAQSFCEDVGSTVASIQRGYDEAINIGDLYRAGSVLCVCTSRIGDPDTSSPFSSEADDKSNKLTATFEVISPGIVAEWTEDQLTKDSDSDVGFVATNNSHLLQCSMAAFTLERAAQVIEIGLKSTVGMKASGITNFNSLKNGNTGKYSTYQDFVDSEYCGGMFNTQSKNRDDTYRQEILPGKYTSTEDRYSFFMIQYRDVEVEDWTSFEGVYGVKSQTSQVAYNYLRIEFTSSKRRELRFIPFSGWEIRNQIGAAGGKLHVMNPHELEVQTIDDEVNGIIVRFNGLKDIPLNSFEVQAFKNPDDANEPLGVWDLDDSSSYVDNYPRLAEAFVYDSVSCTANNAPEHEISYVNIIDEQSPPGPQFEDLALLGLNIRSTRELSRLDQLSVYVTQGVIPQHTLPAVFKDLLLNVRYGSGQYFSSQQIDDIAFAAADQFCVNRRYFFDGAVSKKLNLRSWGSQRAADFLLELGISGGRFSLNPVANFYGVEPVAAMFTAGNIIADTFEMNYFDVQDRLLPLVTVKWREERRQLTTGDKGLFPQIREVSVKLKGDESESTEEQIDMSDFCTNEQHAIDRAKWLCLQRQQVTHAVTFKTVPTEAAMNVGSIIAIGIETITTDKPQNGAIALDGTVTCWPQLANGTHDVFIWDGTAEIQERTINVTKGKADIGAGSVFTVKTVSNVRQTYKVQSLSFDEDGNIDVEASYFPTNADGVSTMVETFNNATAWEIN